MTRSTQVEWKPRPLAGPRMPPRSRGQARQLVVLLHGWGSSGDDLIQLSPLFAGALPDAEFVSPHGPERCDQNPAGFQWFGLADAGPRRPEAAARAAVDVNAFIDAQQRRLGLTDRHVALVGFSQGTMMALEVGLQRPVAGILGYSGALLPGERSPTAAEVLLVHGAMDDVLPLDGMYSMVTQLAALGVRLRYHVRPQLGHSIDQEGIELGGDFLRRRFLG